MCQNCWEESGSPAIKNEKTEEAVKLIRKLYATPDGSAGGYGHIVFDDNNVEDRNIDYCLKSAKSDEYGHAISEETRVASIAALNHFSTLTMDERNSALAVIDGLI